MDYDKEKDRNDGECLALIHSEISEALQALRDGNPADTHCPDFSALEVELAKMEYNRTRPMRHGGKRF